MRTGMTGRTACGPRQWAVAGFCVMSSLVLFAAGEGVEAFDRTAAEGAAEIVLKARADEILAGDGFAESNLVVRQLAAPEKYPDPEQARLDLQTAYGDDLAARFKSDAEKVLATLARPAKTEDVFSAAFIATAAELPPDGLEKVLAGAYPGRFAAARRKAVDAQRVTLTCDVHPSEDEVDTLDREALRAVLVERIVSRQQTAVFDENRAYAGEAFADPLIEAAYAQRDEQTAAVKRYDSTCWAPENVRRDLVFRLTADWTARRAKAAPDAWVYRPFPSVTNGVAREAVTTLLAGRLAACADGAPVAADEGAILASFDDEPSKNAKNADFVRAFAPQLEPAVRSWTLEKIEARVPAAERGDFMAFVATVDGETALSLAVSRRVERALLPAVERARAARAAQHAAVESEGDAYGKEIAASVRRGEKKPKLKEVVEKLTEKVTAKWDAVRMKILWKLGETPSPESVARYTPLLPSVVKRIKEKAKAILEQVDEEEKKPEEEPKPEEPKPEDPPPPDDPPPEPLKLALAIAVDRAGDEITAELEMDGVRIGSVRVDATPSKYRKSRARALRQTEEFLGEAIRAKRPPEGSSLVPAVTVKNDFVYYGTVEELLKLVLQTAEATGLTVAADPDGIIKNGVE